jgi:hypothetical protein
MWLWEESSVVMNSNSGRIICHKARRIENTDKGYRSKNTYTLSDNQVAIKALDNCQINFKLVWDCHQSLLKLAEHYGVQLIRGPRHSRILEKVSERAVTDWHTGGQHAWTDMQRVSFKRCLLHQLGALCNICAPREAQKSCRAKTARQGLHNRLKVSHGARAASCPPLLI